MAKPKPTFTVKKSYGESRVKIGGTLKPYNHGESVAVQFAADISTEEARALAAAIIAEADAADEKAAKRKAAEDRRAKWRQREIDAGRMKTMSATQFFAR